MGEVKTFQTIKLPLSVWHLVQGYMDYEQVNFSEACSRLIRYGHGYWDNKLREPPVTDELIIDREVQVVSK